MAYSKKHKHYRTASKNSDCSCNESKQSVKRRSLCGKPRFFLDDDAEFTVEIKHVRGILCAAFSLILLIFIKGIILGIYLQKIVNRARGKERNESNEAWNSGSA